MRKKLTDYCLLMLGLLIWINQSEAQQVLNFKISQPPQLIVNAGIDTFMYAGDSMTLGGNPTATGGTPPFTYQWSPGTGLDDATKANPIAFPGSSTTYTLTVTDATKCQYSDQVYLKVSLTEIGELAGHLKFRLYPNPSQGTFRLELTGMQESDQLKAEIYNPIGQKVYENEISGQQGRYEEEIILDKRVKGVFIVRLTGGQTMMVKELIVY